MTDMDTTTTYMNEDDTQKMYGDTEKANEMLHSTEEKYPKENTFISFDDNIPFSTQNAKHPQENNLEQEQIAERPTAEKLLPFLNAKANNLDGKLEVLSEKKAVREDKISSHEAKINRLSARADRLEDMNELLKSTLSGVPFIQNMIRKNEEKIQKIRTEKIPNRQEKINIHKAAIDRIDKKASRIQHKLDRCLALNSAIKSFSLTNNADRRMRFAQAMDKLHSSTLNCMNDKHEILTKRKTKLTQIYNQTDPSIDRIVLKATIRKTNSKLDKLTDKINRLNINDQTLFMKPAPQIDEAIVNTSQKIAEHIDSGDLSIPVLSEAICLEIYGEPQQREQDNYLKNAEMAMEDDYNSIDGIINNGPKETAPVPEQELPIPESEPSHNTEMLAQIADLMEVSVSELESKPDDIKASLCDMYIANSSMDPDSLKLLMSEIATLDSSPSIEIKEKSMQQDKTKEENQYSDKTVAQLIESDSKQIEGNETPHEPKKQSFSIGRIKSSQKKLAAQSSKQQSKERKQERSHQELS